MVTRTGGHVNQLHIFGFVVLSEQGRQHCDSFRIRLHHLGDFCQVVLVKGLYLTEAGVVDPNLDLVLIIDRSVV